MKLRVAGAQMPVGRDVRENLVAIGQALEFAAGESADILLTPEGSTVRRACLPDNRLTGPA